MRHFSLREVFSTAAGAVRKGTVALFLSTALAATAFADPPSVQTTEPEKYESLLFRKNVQAESGGTALSGAFLKKACYKADVSGIPAPAVPAVGNLVTEPQPAQTIREMLEGLRSSSVIGEKLVRHAVSGGVQFCALGILPQGVAAQYLPESKRIATGIGEDPLKLHLTMAHEILHHAQNDKDLLNYRRSWDIESRMARNLSIEAAAVTVEFLVALDAKGSGNPAYWEKISTGYSGYLYADKEIYPLIEETYDAALKTGVTRNVALLEAGRIIWPRALANADFLNFYVDLELRRVIEDLRRGEITPEAGLRQGQFGPDKVADAGMISDFGTFTRDSKFPPMAELLRYSDKMRWSYEVVNIAFHERVFGAASAEAALLRRKAAEGGNPYLALDFSKADIHANTFSNSGPGDKFQYLYEWFDSVIEKRRLVDNRSQEATAPAPVPPKI